MTTKGIGRRALSGITWTLMGAIVANAARFAVIPILGRLLSKGDFGVVAVAMTVVLFSTRFSQLGLGMALVQRKTIEPAHVATTLATMLLLGAAMTFTVFIAADGIASSVFNMERAAGPIRAISALFIIRALSLTSRALLQRELRFRALATTNVVAYVIGSAASIALALSGAGLWSLIIGYLVEASVETGLILIVCPPRVVPRVDIQALRDLFGFGSGQTVAAIGSYLATQGDYIVVGRYLGDAMLGIYTRAYELMRFPALIFTQVAGTVLFSSFAKLQDEPERLGQMFRRVLFANAIVLLPVSAGLIVLAPEAIRILLGPGWSDVVLPFQIMATSMLFRTSYKAAGLVARSTGDVMRMAGSELAYAAAVIGGALYSMRWGIIGVSVTTGIAIILQFLNLSRLALRRITIGWRGLFGAHVDGLVLAMLVVVTGLPIARALRSAGCNVVQIAVVTAIVGSLLPLAYAIARLRSRARDWTWMADRVRDAVSKKKNKKNKHV